MWLDYDVDEEQEERLWGRWRYPQHNGIDDGRSATPLGRVQTYVRQRLATLCMGLVALSIILYALK